MSHQITDETIVAIKAAGFSVYMRDRKDSWLIFTDGKNLGYLQNNRFRGLSLSTVHMPNTTTGTGYKIADGLADTDLTADMLRRAFAFAPAWASRDTETIKKYAGIKAYKRRDSFSGAYTLVA